MKIMRIGRMEIVYVSDSVCGYQVEVGEEEEYLELE